MTPAAPGTKGRWLYGPASDLLFGCGLWYVLALAAFMIADPALRTGGGATIMPFLVLVFSTPHYGATLLRVYERREDRRAYTSFAVHASLVIAAIFALGVHNGFVGSLILTVYFTWSPWHYTGQNYGIAVMFLRRRGIDLPARVKRPLYASFILSYALTFLALHSGARASHYAPVSYQDATYSFMPIGFPEAWAGTVFIGVGLLYVAALAGTAVLLLRRASLRQLAPVAMLALTQALWFTIPLWLRRWELDAGIEPWAKDFGSYYFLWIAIGHAVQYLWITSFYARSGPAWSGRTRYFVKAILAGAGIWALPAILFAPALLGRLPFEAGLSVLVAATVNIHHFVLDGAIWKLRDGRVARILLRARESPGPDADRPPGLPPRRGPGGRLRRGLGASVWVTGALCLAIMFGAKWEREVGVRQALAAGNLVRVRRAMDRLAWLGRESPKLHMALGRVLERKQREGLALAEYEQSLALYPSAPAWFAIGALHLKRQEWAPAAEAFEDGVALDHLRGQDHYTLGLALLELHQPERARDAFARAVDLNPTRKIHRTMLERAEAAIPSDVGP